MTPAFDKSALISLGVDVWLLLIRGIEGAALKDVREFELIGPTGIAGFIEPTVLYFLIFSKVLI